MAKPHADFERGFILRIDRGSTCAVENCRALAFASGGRRSMSPKADCFDNAVAASAFRTIKKEGIGEAIPETIAEARALTFAYIEGFYDTKRLHSTLEC